MGVTSSAYVMTVAALVGAGIAPAAPPAAPPSYLQLRGVGLTAADQDIVIDFVRHGETVPPDNVVASPVLPGAELDDVGEQQAQNVADQLSQAVGSDGIAGIFAGQNIRAIETAEPLAMAEHMETQILPGLNEMDAGMYGGLPLAGPAGILFELTEFAWALGLYSVPMPASIDANGAAFESLFGGAVDTMYSDAVTDSTAGTGQITDVAFSGEAAISAWVLMNVDNPDIAIFLPLLIDSLNSGDGQPFLANGGVVEVEGNPTDGWTLLSFDGHPIPQDPGLLTDLLIDLRSVITPPQTAAYDLSLAALSGDSTLIASSFESGLVQVGTSLLQLPGSVVGDIVDAVRQLGTDLAAGESIGDAFGSAIVGLT